MATTKVVETLYSDYSKYEVVKKTGTFSTKFYVRKDGEVASGSFSSLRAAIKWAEEKSGDKR